jgi:Na+-translocating ferredoxin:NAD+ oxidoreductase subunit B
VNPTIIIISTAALGAIGAVAAALLAVSSRVFRVEEDPRIAAIGDVLPGANCGGCGYPGCPGFATALVKGEADPSACAPAGADTIKAIGEILGVTVAEKVRLVARLHCQGAIGVCGESVVYAGLTSCEAVTLLTPRGTRACPQGCEGLGDCVTVCPFDAIRMGDKGLPLIDEEKCTGCGKCITACPKHLLHLEGYAQNLLVGCSTRLAAKLVMKSCTLGCIQCRACLRACPYDALAWEDGLPRRIDERCRSCGLCVEVCKPGSLVMVVEPQPEVKEEATRLAAERKAAEAAKKAAAKVKAAAKPAAAAATEKLGATGEATEKLAAAAEAAEKLVAALETAAGEPSA